LWACTLLAATALWGCSPAAPTNQVDQLGRPVGRTEARRIVALAPDVVELVCALGAADRLVAVSRAADFPPAVRAIRHVREDDPEAIVALRPDLVVATTAGNDERVIDRIRATGTPVFVTDVTSFERLAEAAVGLGAIIHASAQGRRLGAEIDARYERAAARAARLPRRRALYVVWWDPLIVAAPGTFPNDLLLKAGLANLTPAHGGHYPRVPPETLLDPRLEAIVSPDEPDTRTGFEQVLRSPAGTRLAAGLIRLYWLPADLADRPGPRLPDALERLVVEREANP
jgi:cobalamin transport system substrate-binding protein